MVKYMNRNYFQRGCFFAAALTMMAMGCSPRDPSSVTAEGMKVIASGANGSAMEEEALYSGDPVPGAADGTGSSEEFFEGEGGSGSASV